MWAKGFSERADVAVHAKPRHLMPSELLARFVGRDTMPMLNRRCLILIVIFVLLGTSQVRAEEINESVGTAAQNDPDDVLVVQLLLNQIPADDGGPEELLVTDGLAGPLTIAAIRRFQLKAFGVEKADGRVAPGEQTITRLTKVVSSRPLRDRVVRIASGERLFWGNGKRTETQAIVSSRLQKYWKAAGFEFTLTQLRDPDFQAKWPWSAAFVSWVMKTAGAGDDFRYTASHWRYVAAAKANRIAGNDKPTRAYRVEEHSVEIGDIVVKRRASMTATYDNIESGHPTHGDIVVAIEDGRAVTIGGNVGHSVRTTFVDLDDDHKINDPNFFAVLKID